MRRALTPAGLAVGAALLLAAAASPHGIKEGGTFRISLQPGLAGLDFVDPALASTPAAWALLDTTCARLLAYPDKAAPASYHFEPEVAKSFPEISADRKTYTFTLRKGFRFNDGSPVRASAFARAIDRMLAPGLGSPGAQHVREIVGAAEVRAGKKTSASGVVARGHTLVVRLTRPAPDFLHRTTSTFFCAVPPALPADPEGLRTFPAAGPYYVAEHSPGERLVLRRNPHYSGTRPHHVDGFVADLRATSPQEVLDDVERGEADWGHTTSSIYFEPGRNLIGKYGLDRSRFFVRPGFTLRMLAFNSARPLFKGNTRLRKAVNFALDRRAIANGVSGSGASVASDQYLPASMRGFTDAAVYPLARPNLKRARELAGDLRGAKAVLYTNSSPPPMAFGQLVKEQLSAIGLEVEVRGHPLHTASATYQSKLATRGEPWDLALALWQPSYVDPYAYINQLFDARYIGGTNFLRFDSRKLTQLVRRAARMTLGADRQQAYGALDVQLARDIAPIAAVDFLKEPTLVSERVGCVVLRPVLDLTAVCLK